MLDGNTCGCQVALRQVGSVYCDECERYVKEEERKKEELIVDPTEAHLTIHPLNRLQQSVELYTSYGRR